MDSQNVFGRRFRNRDRSFVMKGPAEAGPENSSNASGQCAAAAASPLRHVLMNVLRASPASFSFEASALQDFIFSCCVCFAGAAAVVSPLRQVLMNVLRSSPVLPVACLLQSTMRCCCGVSGFAAALSVAFVSCADAIPQP